MLHKYVIINKEISITLSKLYHQMHSEEEKRKEDKRSDISTVKL